MHGVFLDLDSINPADLDLKPLRDSLPDWTFHGHTAADQLAARIGKAQIIVSNKVPIDRHAMEIARDLKLICVAATGTNNIDLKAATGAGVIVSNARDYATASVVEHVLLMMLTLSRRLDSYRVRSNTGDWAKSKHFCLFDDTIEELAGKTLGIVGYGVLGKAVASMATALSMRVIVAQRLHDEPLPGRTPFEQVLAQSDILTLHCPLSEETRGRIGTQELQSMKRSAILINAARGGIVDEQALLSALQQGWIAGAAVDVLEQEPPPASHPLLLYAAQVPQLIVTPHIAWASRAARQRLVQEIAANIGAFLQGTPRNKVM